MENKIGVGIIVGIVIAIGMLIYNSENYTSFQKKIILPSLLFLPAGIIFILIFWLYNKSENNNFKTKSQNQKTEIPLNNLVSSKKINQENIIPTPKTPYSEIEEKISIFSKKIQLLKTSFEQDLLSQQEFNDKKKVIELEIEKLIKILDEAKLKESILKENQHLFENLLELKALGLISDNEYVQKEQLLFSTLQEKQGIDYGLLKDIDKNCYKTILIGNQTWMTENLNVSKFRNGELIKEAQSIEEWSYCAENKIPAWCYYQNNPEFAEKYGKLYNWYAAADSRGIAPIGWRVALIMDWENFKKNIESSKKYLIPNGKRWHEEGFVEIDSWGWYWTAEEWHKNNKLGLEVYYTNDDISTTGQWYKETGMAIRCVEEK